MLNSHFREMLSALADAEAEYLLIGAYAMAAHGCPRATGDIDLWVRPTAENAAKVWAALLAFRAPTSGVTPQDFTEPDLVYQIGLPPQRIDLLTGVDGVNFDEAWPNRLLVELDGLTVPVIARDDLKRNKKATGRQKDLQDLNLLSEHPE